MKLIQRNRDAAYLQYDKYVDFDNPMVMEKAMDLTKNCRSVYEKIETIYYFVRDEIDHTWDAKDSTITISASDVLEKKTGISYSKANPYQPLGFSTVSKDGLSRPFYMP